MSRVEGEWGVISLNPDVSFRHDYMLEIRSSDWIDTDRVTRQSDNPLAHRDAVVRGLEEGDNISTL